MNQWPGPQQGQTMPSQTTLTAAPVDTNDPATYEQQHVHSVYDQIAPHFSITRYKVRGKPPNPPFRYSPTNPPLRQPWPIIAKFILSLPPGAVGLDSGTGNGKYLPLCAGTVWTVGLDRSRALLEIAQTAGGARREVVWGDALTCGWRVGAFDYALSIATIHHFATPSRRRAAIEALLRCVRPSQGRVLVCVWAMEQDELSRRVLPPSGAQDVFVPWVLQQREREHDAAALPGPGDDRVFQRYYHMFAAGELAELVRGAAAALGLEVGPPNVNAPDGIGVQILREGWERSNWYIELRRWQV